MEDAQSWHEPIHTEAQVVEIEPGVLMLNMRDNRGGSWAIAITKDLGKTWTEHPLHVRHFRNRYVWPVLIMSMHKDNVLNKDILSVFKSEYN